MSKVVPPRDTPTKSAQQSPGDAEQNAGAVWNGATLFLRTIMTDKAADQPSDPNAPILRPHVFDGIQEYDQKLPNWWLFTFYFTIAWFIIYWFFYYQMGWFTTDHDRVTAEIGKIQEAKAKELESMLSKIDDNVLWEWSRNSQIVAEGKVTYDKYCFTCHAPDLTAVYGGAKLPGLPLHDKEWKYGNNPMSLFNMVAKGSPDKTAAVQMPPWEQVLGPAEMAKSVAFVLSHHDQKDPGVVTGAGAAPGTAPAPGTTPPATPAPTPPPGTTPPASPAPPPTPEAAPGTVPAPAPPK